MNCLFHEDNEDDCQMYSGTSCCQEKPAPLKDHPLKDEVLAKITNKQDLNYDC